MVSDPINWIGTQSSSCEPARLQRSTWLQRPSANAYSFFGCAVGGSIPFKRKYIAAML